MKYPKPMWLTIVLLFGFVHSQGDSNQANTNLSKTLRLQFAANITTCDHLLLLNNELEPIRFPTFEKNFICKNLKSNCCTLASQQMLYTQWVNSGTRDGIVNLYGQFIKVFNQIFNNFKRVETFASKVVDNTAKRKQSSCRTFAEAVLALGASAQKSKVLDIVKKAYRFLYDARRGFSCSLCDAEAHKFINGAYGKITQSHFFCKQMVEATLPYPVFLKKFFPKISRAIGQFVSSCSIDGLYKPNKSLKYDIKFFKDQALLNHIDKCQNNSRDSGAVSFCSDYCSHFNPIRYDAMFEGDLPKLLAYNAWLKKVMDKSVKVNKKSFSKGDLKFEGRLLATSPATPAPATTSSPKPATPRPVSQAASKPATKTTGSGSSSKNKSVGFTGLDYTAEVNHMRKEFGLQLKTGITYSASENFTDLFDINYQDSFYSQLPKPVYDLSKFSTDFDKNGINYLYYGYITAMNDATNAQLLSKKAGITLATQPVGGQKQKDSGVSKTTATSSSANKKP